MLAKCRLYPLQSLYRSWYRPEITNQTWPRSCCSLITEELWMEEGV